MMRIDPHVHLRDWQQQEKETLVHGLYVAVKAGLHGVVEMPNTNPTLTATDTIIRRLEDGSQACDQVFERCGIRPWHALYAGITGDPCQITEAVRLWRAYPGRIAGLKLFAGHSTGNMGLITPQAQRSVYEKLVSEGFDGLLAVHAEKETLLEPDLWDPSEPASHSTARPPQAEISSVQDQIRFARETGYTGTLHICHISCPEALDLLEVERAAGTSFRLTCGVTPHHALLDSSSPQYRSATGSLLKMNPPLRSPDRRRAIYQALCNGRIDWIESDHAPHTLADKMAGASGIPALAGIPLLVAQLKATGVTQDRIDALTGGRFLEVTRINPVSGVGLASVNGSPKRDPFTALTPEELLRCAGSLSQEYPWDPWEELTET